MSDLVLVDHAQGSEEWHALRRTKRPASITPMLMGASKFGDAGDAYDAMLGDAAEDDTFIGVLRDYGNRTEPKARTLVGALIGKPGFPVVGYRGDYLASMDFFTTRDGKRIGVEIKCPYQKERSGTWKAALKGIIEPGYADQIAHQFEVFSLDEAYLFVYIDDSKHKLLRYEPDGKRWTEITKTWDRFVRDHLDTFSRPNPYAQRTDPAWLAAAEKFLIAKAAVDEAEGELALARDTLVKLADGKKSEGGEVRVNIYQSRGSVDYKAIAAEFDAEIRAADPEFTPETFRKAPSTKTVVSPIKEKVDGQA